MCNCEKIEMKEEEIIRAENAKLKEEKSMMAEEIMNLIKQNNELSNKNIEFPVNPIECASLLICADFEYGTNSIQRAFGAREKVRKRLYTVSELRQIAEHLLVYCNYNEGSEIE